MKTNSWTGIIKKEVLMALIVCLVIQPFSDLILSLLGRSKIWLAKKYIDSCVILASSELNYFNLTSIVLLLLILSILLNNFINEISEVNSMDNPQKNNVDKIITRKNQVLFKNVLTVLIVLIVLNLILFIYHCLLLFNSEKIKSEFNQNLKILAVVISEQEEEELIASWASMTNIDDYRKIIKTMNDIAKENKIRLKKMSL